MAPSPAPPPQEDDDGVPSSQKRHRSLSSRTTTVSNEWETNANTTTPTIPNHIIRPTPKSSSADLLESILSHWWCYSSTTTTCLHQTSSSNGNGDEEDEATSKIPPIPPPRLDHVQQQLIQFLQLQQQQQQQQSPALLSTLPPITTPLPPESSQPPLHITMTTVSQLLHQARNIFYEMAKVSNQKQTRVSLRQTATSVFENNHTDDDDSEDTSLLTLCLILTSLAVPPNHSDDDNGLQICRSAASAIVSTLHDHYHHHHHPSIIIGLDHEEEDTPLRRWIRPLLRSILVVHRHIHQSSTTTTNTTAATTTTIDFHIVLHLAKFVGLDHCGTGDHDDDDDISELVTFAIVHGLQSEARDNSNNNNNNNDDDADDPTRTNDNDNNDHHDHTTRVTLEGKENNTRNTNHDTLTTMLALAAQFRPWHRIDPVPLVELAMDHSLWHSADLICASAIAPPHSSGPHDPNQGIPAVLTYIDMTLQRRAHRQADKIATAFFAALATSDDGVWLLERYFLNARYLHACNTIVKLIRKGVVPVIERQVERIDQSVLKVREHSGVKQDVDANSVPVVSAQSPSNNEPFYEGGTTLECASTDIRNFALQKLEESGDMDSAQRLANIWGMDYLLDPEVMKLADERRKKLYIQWDDVFPHQPIIPDLITTPEALDHAVMTELGSSHNVYGFDVEWGYDDDTGIVGAALLQIATVDSVILVDIPALSRTNAGVEALERHINPLFHDPTIVMIGFSCREDLSKLRSSPCVRADRHWFHGSRGPTIVDLQGMIARLKIAQLPRDNFGLSRACEYYLMKPLDKSEQCSEWSQRPLSLKQRIYAALDAYVCAVIYSKIVSIDNETSAVDSNAVVAAN